MVPAMKKERLPQRIRPLRHGAASIMGPIIPPSIPFRHIMACCQYTIGDLFYGRCSAWRSHGGGSY